MLGTALHGHSKINCLFKQGLPKYEWFNPPKDGADLTQGLVSHWNVTKGEVPAFADRIIVLSRRQYDCAKSLQTLVHHSPVHRPIGTGTPSEGTSCGNLRMLSTEPAMVEWAESKVGKVLLVNYEELTGGGGHVDQIAEPAARKICTFLEVPYEPLIPATEKTGGWLDPRYAP